MSYDPRDPVVPVTTEEAVIRNRPWYQTGGGIVAISLLAVLIIGFALYAAMEIGANQSCADLGGERTGRVCSLPTQDVVVDEDPVVVPAPAPTYVVPPSPATVITEEQACIDNGGTWDGSVCLP